MEFNRIIDWSHSFTKALLYIIKQFHYISSTIVVDIKQERPYTQKLLLLQAAETQLVPGRLVPECG